MNKRGQFFLIAALIIATLIISLSTVYISVKTQKHNSKVYDLSNELDFEGAQILAYGEISEIDNIGEYISNLTSYYSALNTDKKIIVLYGSDKYLYYGCENTGSVGLESNKVNLCSIESNPDRVSREGNELSIQLSNNERNVSLDLNTNSNFYVVIISDQGSNEDLVVAGSDS